MRVHATPRPSPARGVQIAAAMRFPVVDADRPGRRPGAHGAARFTRDTPAEGRRLADDSPPSRQLRGTPRIWPLAPDLAGGSLAAQREAFEVVELERLKGRGDAGSPISCRRV